MGKSENLIEKQEKSFKVLRTFLDSAAEMLEMNLDNLKETHSEILDTACDQKSNKFQNYNEQYEEMVQNLQNAFCILSFSLGKVKSEKEEKKTPLDCKSTVDVKKVEPLESKGKVLIQMKPKSESSTPKSVESSTLATAKPQESAKALEIFQKPSNQLSNINQSNSINDWSRIETPGNRTVSNQFDINNSRTLNNFNLNNSRTLNTYNFDHSRTLNTYNYDNSRTHNSYNQNIMMPPSIFGYGMPASRGCSCRTGCDTRRCGCVKRGERCSSACHVGNSFCMN